MDNETATKILAAELAKNSGISIVREDWHKKELIEKALHYNQFSNPIVIDYGFHKNVSYTKKDGSKSSQDEWFFTNNDIRSEVNLVYSNLEKIITNIESYQGANYFFVDNPIQDKPAETSESTETSESSRSVKGFHIFVTPYSIIGEKEITNIKKTFYKGVPANVVSAMDSLDIKNYVDIYERYLTSNFNEIYFKSKYIHKFLNYVQDMKFDGAGEMGSEKIKALGSIDKLNSELQRIGIKSRLSTKYGRSKGHIKDYPNDIHKTNVMQVVDEIKQIYNNDYTKCEDQDLLNEFSNFIFTTPYEDQNVHINKSLLCSNGCNLDYLTILEKEYTKGRHFQEYFNYLGPAEQQKFVRYLNAAGQEHNIAHDSFLWSKGFTDVQLDYMDLYKDNAEGFIDYFSSKDPEEKKIIIKDIMGCEHTNKPVAKWLDENELELVREVGLDG